MWSTYDRLPFLTLRAKCTYPGKGVALLQGTNIKYGEQGPLSNGDPLLSKDLAIFLLIEDDEKEILESKPYIEKGGPHPRKTHKRVYVIMNSPSRDV